MPLRMHTRQLNRSVSIVNGGVCVCVCVCVLAVDVLARGWNGRVVRSSKTMRAIETITRGFREVFVVDFTGRRRQRCKVLVLVYCCLMLELCQVRTRVAFLKLGRHR